MKVVVLSAYRSATQSTDLLLKNLGYKTLHYGGDAIKARSNILDNTYKIISNYDAFSDNPFPVMYEHFDTQYPGSKFILIKRDPDSWYNSILAINEYLKKSEIDPFEKTFFNAYLDKVPKSFKDIPYEDYILCYNRHIEAVENYFKNKDNLLILDISDSKKGIKIANFLNKDIFPKVDFIK
jgi:hypothetical protein